MMNNKYASGRPAQFVERNPNPLHQNKFSLGISGQTPTGRNYKSWLFVFVIAALIIYFLVDFATTKYSIWLLVCATDWLKEVDFGTCLTILVLFGVFSPPLGAPFTIYPLLVSFIIGARTGSQVEAVLWGVGLTCTALTLGGWLGFLMSRCVDASTADASTACVVA